LPPPGELYIPECKRARKDGMMVRYGRNNASLRAAKRRGNPGKPVIGGGTLPSAGSGNKPLVTEPVEVTFSFLSWFASSHAPRKDGGGRRVVPEPVEGRKM